MKWNKINLRMKDKNLPPIGERVLFATYDDSHSSYHQIIGQLTISNHIDTGYRMIKVTSKFHWMPLPEDPVVENVK